MGVPSGGLGVTVGLLPVSGGGAILSLQQRRPRFAPEQIHLAAEQRSPSPGHLRSVDGRRDNAALSSAEWALPALSPTRSLVSPHRCASRSCNSTTARN